MISSAINNLILDLKPREREVISSRFGLGKKDRETLASLGKKYGITRERVRQIEAEALRRIKEESLRERLLEILEHVCRYLMKIGGAKREDLLVEDLKSNLDDSNLHSWHIRFLKAANGKPLYYPADEELHSFWYLDEETIRIIRRFLGYLEKNVAARKEELFSGGKIQNLLAEAVRSHKLSEPIGLNYISLSKKFKTNPFGDFGLSSWEEIDPKAMGSKAYLVIKKLGRPIHFRNVAEEINKAKFDDKKALPQTIHNELIKDDRFVLVGRGIYGLKEQGYVPGTAKEVIAYILKKAGPMSAEEVVKALAKQRFLERNTIVLNLQNKKYFKRLPDARYALK